MRHFDQSRVLKLIKPLAERADEVSKEHWTHLSEERRKEIQCGEGPRIWIERREEQLLERMGSSLLKLLEEQGALSFPFEGEDLK